VAAKDYLEDRTQAVIARPGEWGIPKPFKTRTFDVFAQATGVRALRIEFEARKARHRWRLGRRPNDYAFFKCAFKKKNGPYTTLNMPQHHPGRPRHHHLATGVARPRGRRVGSRVSAV